MQSNETRKTQHHAIQVKEQAAGNYGKVRSTNANNELQLNVKRMISAPQNENQFACSSCSVVAAVERQPSLLPVVKLPVVTFALGDSVKAEQAAHAAWPGSNATALTC